MLHGLSQPGILFINSNSALHAPAWHLEKRGLRMLISSGIEFEAGPGQRHNAATANQGILSKGETDSRLTGNGFLTNHGPFLMEQ